jgi:AraC-like DNA-binding protein
VRAIADGRGGLTVGTDSGVFRSARRGFVALPEAHRNRPLDVRCLHEDAEGVLWIGTDGSGLLRLSGDSLAFWTTDDGLPDNAVFGIAEDVSGALWMGTGKGLFRALREDFGRAPGAGKPFVHPLVLDEEEGLPGRSCGAEGRPALTAGRSGRILAALGSGVAVVDPAAFSAPARTPKSVVESVTVDGRVHPAAGEGPRSFRGRRLEFAFTAPCLDAPEKVRFRYRLEGSDPDWRYLKPSARRTAVYENLAPKKHRFLVQAAGNGGSWESGGPVLEFGLSRPGIAGPALLWGMFPALAALYGIVRAFGRLRAGRNPRPKYRTSALAPERTEAVYPMLLELMEREKPHLDPNLTLPALAKMLRIHPNHLSQIIHEKLDLSFNDFVNRHRIGEAQRRMADPASRDKTVLEILLETGFYSKSVFNSAFKKVTGMTPSEFKKSLP